jgi:hypothetical protein
MMQQLTSGGRALWKAEETVRLAEQQALKELGL